MPGSSLVHSPSVNPVQDGRGPRCGASLLLMKGGFRGKPVGGEKAAHPHRSTAINCSREAVQQIATGGPGGDFPVKSSHLDGL